VGGEGGSTYTRGGDALVEGAICAGEVALGIDATAAVAAREREERAGRQRRRAQKGGSAGVTGEREERLTPLRARCGR